MERLLKFIFLFGIIASFFSCLSDNEEKIGDRSGKSI